METKPFYLTSEFWLAFPSAVFVFGNSVHLWDAVPRSWSTLAGALIAGLYAVGRGTAKSGTSYTK
jgi:hypothetical protein